MPMLMSPHVVQNVGELEIEFAHQKILKGIAMHIGGLRLQGEFFSMSQAVDNSLIVPLLGGGSVQLTNSNHSGTVTFNAIRTGFCVSNLGVLEPQPMDANGNPTTHSATAFYDIVSIADALRDLDGGDGSGGTIRFRVAFNGNTITVVLHRVTLVRSPPYLASGNDIPNYQVVFNYGYLKVVEGTPAPSSYANELSDTGWTKQP